MIIILYIILNFIKEIKNAPKEITGWDFRCYDNPLVSLEGLPKKN